MKWVDETGRVHEPDFAEAFEGSADKTSPPFYPRRVRLRGEPRC